MRTESSTVEFEIKPSKYLAVFIAILHFIALLAIISTQIPEVLQTLLGIVIMFHFGMQHRQYRSQKLVKKLIFSEDSGWQLANERTIDVIEIQPSTIVTTFLVIVHYRFVLSEDNIQSLVCFNDSLSSKDFKSLIVKLKIEGLRQCKSEKVS